MKALILTDGKPGHENQSVALCRHLGLDFETATVSYSFKLVKALSYLLDNVGLYAKIFDCDLPCLESFSLIISTGSTTFYPNKVLARTLGVPNIAILNPKGYRSDFTWILCPAHDHPPERENIVQLPLSLCAVDVSFYEEKAKEFKIKHTPKTPSVGFIIGGPNATSAIDPLELRAQLEQAFALTKECEHWVTTSRRTPPEVEAVIQTLPFDYRLINSSDPYNPVPAFIQLCNRLFVTSDSASMISECCSFGAAKVEVLINRQHKARNKFMDLIQQLEQRNAAHIFDGTLGKADQKIDLQPMLKNILTPTCELSTPLIPHAPAFPFGYAYDNG